MLGVAAGCGRSPTPVARLQVLVTPASKDTVRFDAQASARRCAPGGRGGLVLEGASGGNGVLVWLRYRDSLATGDWPLLQRTDTGSATGAIVAVRFVFGEAARGLSLDSGAAAVRWAGALLSVRVRGSGLELVGARRVGVAASFESVPLGADTVPCEPAP